MNSNFARLGCAVAVIFCLAAHNPATAQDDDPLRDLLRTSEA